MPYSLTFCFTFFTMYVDASKTSAIFFVDQLKGKTNKICNFSLTLLQLLNFSFSWFIISFPVNWEVLSMFNCLFLIVSESFSIRCSKHYCSFDVMSCYFRWAYVFDRSKSFLFTEDKLKIWAIKLRRSRCISVGVKVSLVELPISNVKVTFDNCKFLDKLEDIFFVHQALN